MSATGLWLGFVSTVVAADPSPEFLAAAAANVRQVVAHRGSSVDRPENTLASTLRAIEVGATAVEVDVRSTRDGRLVLSHDAELSRATDGKGVIGDKTWDELRHVDAGRKFGAQFAGERIPLLEEVLHACQRKIDVLLDLKETGDDYIVRVVKTVQEHGEPQRTIVGVRSVEQAREFRRLLPMSRQIGLIGTPQEIEAYSEAGVETIRLWPKWLGDDTLVERVRKTGKQLHLNGTAGASEDLAPLLAHRPESISGDDPARIRATLRQLQQPASK